MLGGTVVELLEFAHRPLARRDETTLGYTNISLSVRDLDAALAAITAAGLQPDKNRWRSGVCGCSSSATRTAPRSSSCCYPNGNEPRPRCGATWADGPFPPDRHSGTSGYADVRRPTGRQKKGLLFACHSADCGLPASVGRSS